MLSSAFDPLNPHVSYVLLLNWASQAMKTGLWFFLRSRVYLTQFCPLYDLEYFNIVDSI